jgi:hypothetical protein
MIDRVSGRGSQTRYLEFANTPEQLAPDEIASVVIVHISAEIPLSNLSVRCVIGMDLSNGDIVSVFIEVAVHLAYQFPHLGLIRGG